MSPPVWMRNLKFGHTSLALIFLNFFFQKRFTREISYDLVGRKTADSFYEGLCPPP